MRYRDALDASKGCPKCCSKTFDRFQKRAPAVEKAPPPVPEKAVEKVEEEKKRQPRNRK